MIRFYFGLIGWWCWWRLIWLLWHGKKNITITISSQHIQVYVFLGKRSNIEGNRPIFGNKALGRQLITTLSKHCRSRIQWHTHLQQITHGVQQLGIGLDSKLKIFVGLDWIKNSNPKLTSVRVCARNLCIPNTVCDILADENTTIILP